ncbi:MAG TPA: DEAD/DEAH box helicase [Thermoanaerobaculia bacterium]|nr:DEAD/DEAH box helicase [Thermoanaerobaculia bacterium]
MNFSELGLRDSLLTTISSLGYEVPTPIQERTIPILLAGRDLIGQAQTGTGKTAAFALPILEKIDPAARPTQALVLTPTRELAMQVAEALHTYAHSIQGLSVLPVYGGAPIVHQLKRLERGVHIVVGTPGRIIDHLERKSLRLDSIRMVVLDEADEMLKMGFIDDVERILGEMPPTRQIALFSATMPPEVLRIAQKHMPDAERVSIEHKAHTTPAIDQRFLNVSEGQKLDALTQILELEENDATLIFRRTKNGAAELAERLEARGFGAVAMHGDMKQTERESVIRRLRAGAIEIVVATDVAARGLDVEQITHVVNYDIPYDVEAYVHRIGRTGRAGRSGMATLFITPRERKMMREIERYTGMPIKPMRMPTQADVAARRVSQLKDTIRKNLSEGDLDLYLELVEQLVEEGPHDMAEVAAAAARLASSAKPIVEPPSEPLPSVAPATRRRETAAESAAPHQQQVAKPIPSVAPHQQQVAKTKLSMGVGKRDGIRPADVVGSIANEANVPGRDIGPIEIRDDITFVMIPDRYVEQVLQKVGRKRFRGRALNVRVAGSEGPATPRRPPFDKFMNKKRRK